MMRIIHTGVEEWAGLDTGLSSSNATLHNKSTILE